MRKVNLYIKIISIMIFVLCAINCKIIKIKAAAVSFDSRQLIAGDYLGAAGDFDASEVNYKWYVDGEETENDFSSFLLSEKYYEHWICVEVQG